MSERRTRRGREISTHALLAEGDAVSASTLLSLFLFQPTPSLRRATPCGSVGIIHHLHFNPRPPCGGRLHSLRRGLLLLQFQPTPSLRRATSSRAGAGRPSPHFNPRPPCGGRLRCAGSTGRYTHFNPRPPCGGRLQRQRYEPCAMLFQPTPSLRRATRGGTK